MIVKVIERFLDSLSDCESDKSVMMMVTTMNLDPQRHRKAENERG
jgi:hypothetical protein